MTASSNTPAKSSLRFSFAFKLALAFALLVTIATGGSMIWVYQQTRSLVIEQMRNRLKDIGRTGTFLFEQQHRQDLRKLLDIVHENMEFSNTPEQAAILADEEQGTYESLPPELSSKVMESPEFQRVVTALRQIREGSRWHVRPLYDIPALDIIRAEQEDLPKDEQDFPTLEYIYLLAEVPGYPKEQYIMYLADSDYLPVDADGDGAYDGDDDYEGNPIANLTPPLTEEMHMGFSGEAVSEKTFTEDQWGDVVISGYVPILDAQGNVLAVLGMDYNAKSDANRISDLLQFSIATTVVVFILAIGMSILMARLLTRPIKKLQEGAERVGDRDFSTQVDVRSRDELGVLAKSFNSMVTEIREYANNLEELNAAYERFVPQEFLRQMGQNNIIDVKLGDQVMREMTILFSDIRSFTTLSETMTPKENFDFLNAYLQRVSPLIRTHQGFIDKFIGDAIMALFPENVRNAVDGAIDMQAELRSFNDAHPDAPPIRIGIGLHTGNLMLGTIGEERRMESTVISDAVNTASRLEGLTKSFGANILISEYSINMMHQENHSFSSRYLGKVRVKGKRASVNVFEILNADAPDLMDRKLKTKERFEEAIALFQQGKFGDAARIFREVIDANELDSAARAYVDRCERISTDL